MSGLLNAALSPLAVDLPALPPFMAVVAAALLPLAAALTWFFRNRAWLFVGCAALPLLAWTVPDVTDPALAQGAEGFAFELAWGLTVGAGVLALWLRVPFARLPGFLAVVGVKDSAMVLGCLLCVPGFAVLVIWALLEVVAARDPSHAVWLDAVRAASTHPQAWIVANVTGVAALAVAVVLGFAFELPKGFEALLAPNNFDRPSFPSQFVTYTAGQLLYGAGLAVAGAMIARDEVSSGR